MKIKALANLMSVEGLLCFKYGTFLLYPHIVEGVYWVPQATFIGVILFKRSLSV
jgi:hypothetical protein